MSDIRIQPQKLSGIVHIPPSKSMAHRVVIAASLSEGQSVIRNIQLSDDIIATITGMRTLGARIDQVPDPKIDGRVSLMIHGANPTGAQQETGIVREIDANESGSTLRFLVPISSLFPGETHFIGRGKLGSRPMTIYEEIYRDQGLSYRAGIGDLLDLQLAGSLKPGTYTVAGNVSSQFITGLLFTLPLLEEDSQIKLTTELESVGYIYLTLDVLQHFGIQVHFHRAKGLFEIPGGQSYQATDYTVEGDYSQAAFFLVAGALGNDVMIEGLDKDSAQGDKAIMDFLQAFGAEIVEQGDAIQALAPAGGLTGGVTLDGSQCPDIIPVTALASCLATGETVIEHLERLRIKESDRLAATAEELSKLGASIEVVDDSLVINGVASLNGQAEVWSHKDHRMAMMLAVASTVCSEAILIQDSECVAKSYPEFWQDFQKLGGMIDEWRMGK